ncbi:hypothetical protein SFR_3077 [Streptomyces sp. FR-008]|nr:hypothetical protein SFR_3077 [Streptomyces sp. FR-008]
MTLGPTAPVTARPQTPAGLGWTATEAGLRLHLPAPTLRVTDGLKRRPG